MLVIGPCVLLGISVGVMLWKSRCARWALCATALVVAAAVLVGLRLRAVSLRLKDLDRWNAEECRTLALELESEAREYRTKSAGSTFPAGAVSSLQDRFVGASGGRSRVVERCVPQTSAAWTAWDCLPPELNDRSVSRIERAAAAIRQRQRCDTR
jgi:hypothetical protein